MILIIAPYSPLNRGCPTNLGASRKIESVISILSKLDPVLVLLNSAHNEIRLSPLSENNVVISGVCLIEITPPTFINRPLGKLLNIFNIESVFKAIERFGTPKLVWFYNAYAFEMRFALRARTKFKFVHFILEFEDWHFSRRRRFQIKACIDYIFWVRAARLMSCTFVVNKMLAAKMSPYVGRIELLPGIVPAILYKISQNINRVPFDSSEVKVGYFGGLSLEKGADIVLRLATLLPSGFVLHVSGTGHLESEFYEYSRKFPNQIFYYGKVDEVTLYRLIEECDVILNPHTSLAEMDNGVFPFKVIEAIASGRLLISTPVPKDGLESVLRDVQFVPHSAESFSLAIERSRESWTQLHKMENECSAIANNSFGEDALLSIISEVISD